MVLEDNRVLAQALSSKILPEVKFMSVRLGENRSKWFIICTKLYLKELLAKSYKVKILKAKHSLETRNKFEPPEIKVENEADFQEVNKDVLKIFGRILDSTV